MKKVLLIGLTILYFTACKKSNISDYQDYIGVWRNVKDNVTLTLEVKSNGKSFYEEVTKSGNVTKSITHKGRFIIEGSTLKIGFKKLVINKEPTIYPNGIWLLTMDNIEYVGR
jgi:hypothetical protein